MPILVEPFVQDGRLRSEIARELWQRAGNRFPRYELWPPQRDFVLRNLGERDNFIISMPTSAGKTTCAELMIARWLSEKPDAVVVYVAPINALAYELRQTLDARFRRFADVRLITGAYESANPSN